jgi:hypothetical protein
MFFLPLQYVVLWHTWNRSLDSQAADKVVKTAVFIFSFTGWRNFFVCNWKRKVEKLFFQYFLVAEDSRNEYRSVF